MFKLLFLLKVFALFFVSVLTISQTAMANSFAVDMDTKGIALKGYDPVAYFVAGKPVLGSRDLPASSVGAIYYFASEDNRDKYLANPARYTPAYGGFCAVGVTRSKKVTGDSTAWKIVDGRLYINSSPESLVIWSKQIQGNIEKANEIWPVIKDKDPAHL